MPRLGIGQKVALWLGVLVVVLAGIFWFSVDRFAIFRGLFEDITRRDIPNLVTAAELSQETSQLVALAQDLLLTERDYQLRNVEDLIAARLARVNALTDRLNDQPLLSEGAKRMLVRYRDLAEGLNGLVGLERRRIDLTERRRHAYHRLAELVGINNDTERLNHPDESLINRWGASAAWHIHIDSALARLFGIRESTHPELVQRAHTAFSAELDQAEALLAERGQTAADEAWTLLDELRGYGTGANDLFFLAAELIRLRWELEEQVFRQKHLLNLLLEDSARLHQLVREASQSGETAVRGGIDTFFRASLLFGAISLLSLIAIYLVVRGSILRRIAVLHARMQENTQRQPRPIPVEGDDELSAMTREVNYFIDQINGREVQLREAFREADAANRAKGEFMANISHEIRTPINAIFNMAELCLREPLEPRQRKRLELLTDSSGFLLSLINQLLDFARIESHGLTLERLPFSVANLPDALELHVEEARRKGLAFRIEIDPRTPSHLRGDLLRLQQVLGNLVGNAVKFTVRGSVEVAIRRIDEGVTKEAVELEFSVADTGIGIAPEHLETVFAPFVQADSSTTRRFGGSGLGLTISSRLVEAMGGKMALTSTTGKGSRFYFRLKLDRADPETIAPTPGAPQPERFDSLRGAMVLLAEDNEFNQVVARELLDAIGVESVLARNGQEAVELAEQAAFDLILMDVQMPEMDGYQATRAIRKLPGCEAIPIVALTADGMPENRASCLRAGMNEVLLKPITAARLYEQLRRLLDDQTEAQQGEAEYEAIVPDAKLLALFARHHGKTADTILQAIERGDANQGALLCHNLINAARLIQATALRDLAIELELALKQQTRDPEKRGLAQQLAEESARVLNRIERLGRAEEVAC